MKNPDISRIYNREFFENTIDSKQMSATAFAKIIKAYFKPKSVIDVGCGCGIYLKALYDLGVKNIAGYDGSEYAADMSLLPGKIHIHDLREPLKLTHKFDLCICIEVAEHMPNAYAKVLISTLVGLSSRILFTAATPGQGGVHHLNERPHDFWIKLFHEEKYEFNKAMTIEIREEMRKQNVIWWIPKNLMIFDKSKVKLRRWGVC